MGSALKPFPVHGVDKGLRGKETSSLLPDGNFPLAQNVRFLQSGFFLRPGLQPPSPTTIAIGRLQRFYDFYDITRTQFPLAIGTTDVFWQNIGSGAWTSLKSGALTGDPTIPPSVETHSGQCIVTNGVNAPMLLSSSGGVVTVANISGAGAPQSAHLVADYASHVLFAAIINSGGTVQPVTILWGDLNSVSVFNSGDAGTFTFSDTNDPFKNWAKWGDYLVLLRRYSAWLITPTDAPLFYQFNKRSDMSGCGAAGSVQALPMGIVYLGDDGMFQLFNGVQSVPIGEGVWPLLRGGNIPYSQVEKAVSTIDLVNGLYICSIPYGAGATDNSATIVWNYLEGTFTLGTETLTGLGFLASTANVTWNQLTQAWTAYGQTWNSGDFRSGTPTVYASQGTNVLNYASTNNDLGGAIAVTVEYPLRDFGTVNQKRVQKIEVLFQKQTAGSLSVELGYTDYDDRSQITWLPASTIDMSQTSKIIAYFDDVPSRFHAARLKLATANQSLFVTGVVYWYMERGLKLGAP